ncbi:PREDICTED: collagenase-like, partial [Papilio polytes]|uniref:collagenase-like n=1 Tax=Papilio polytes TaxID=76194 RepID=UPI000675C00E
CLRVNVLVAWRCWTSRRTSGSRQLPNSDRLTLLSLFCLGALGALAAAYDIPELNYHERVGIPRAHALRQAELAADFDGSRIVGGSPAALGAYPYMAGQIMMRMDGRESVGGGTLISNTRVLTAAHNLFDGREMVRHVTVVLGSVRIFSGGTRITSNRMEIHSDYDTQTVNNDIAIITINWVNYSNTIRNIGLASGSNMYAGTWAWAIGFGKTSDDSLASPDLMQGRLQVITNEECRQVYGPAIVVASSLCVSGAHGTNVCIGDSGGPLVADGLLIGVTSFSSAAGCEAPRPAGFARVSAFNSWIRSRM